jgi:hypothetical protein
MLGEQVGEGHGKRGYRKVVSAEGGAFSIEVSFESTGKLLGVDAHEVGTYCSHPRSDGSLYGEGQGVVLTADGGVATWKGGGVGKILPTGAVSYRGAVYYSTAYAKWARLNTVAAIFEFEVDPQGNTHTKVWEWK